MTKKSKKVLLVDDDIDFRDATRLLLESEGYAVVEAPNSKEGLRVAKDDSPDVILIDIIMDTYSEGFTFIQQLATNRHTKTIPRLIISSLGLMEGEDYLLPEELGTSKVLKKPLSKAQLLDAIEGALGSGHSGERMKRG